MTFNFPASDSLFFKSSVESEDDSAALLSDLIVEDESIVIAVDGIPAANQVSNVII